MFACRSRASKKSEVESRTIAVLSRVRSTSGTLMIDSGSAAERIAAASASTASPFSTRPRAPAREDLLRSSALASAVRQTTAAPEVAITVARRRCPVEAGQPEVHQHDVGAEPRRGVRRLAPGADRTDDLEPLLEAEEQLERRAVHVVVLDEQDPHDRRRRRHSAERSSG